MEEKTCRKMIRLDKISNTNKYGKEFDEIENQRWGDRVPN